MDEWSVNPRNITLVIDEFANQISKLRRFKNLTDTEIMAAFCCGVVSMGDIRNMNKADCIEFFDKIYDMCSKGENE